MKNKAQCKAAAARSAAEFDLSVEFISILCRKESSVGSQFWRLVHPRGCCQRLPSWWGPRSASHGTQQNTGKIVNKLGTAAQACHPCPWEAEAGDLWVPGQPGSQRETLSKNPKERQVAAYARANIRSSSLALYHPFSWQTHTWVWAFTPATVNQVSLC